MKKLSLKLLAETVAARRKAMKITQTKLAEMTGIHRGLISRLESMDFMPSVDQLQALAEALQFDTAALMISDAAPVCAKAERSYKVAHRNDISFLIAQLA